MSTNSVSVFAPKAIVVGIAGGVVSIIGSMLLPADLPVQVANIIFIPMVAVAGPLGGAIGGAVSGLGSPLLVIAALAGVLGGGVAGWGYRRFVWPQSTIAGRLIAWAVLILVADALSSLVFAIVLPMFDSEMPAFPGSLEAVLGYAAISTAYDIVATTVVMALLPERFRQPLG
mgnify:CR=1 FL=1